MTGPVYLDNAATTPLDPRVLEAMLPSLGGRRGNPSSLHAAGTAAREAVEEAREHVAGLINASPGEIIFTSGGTESDNLAVLGLARAASPRRRHVVAVQAAGRLPLDVEVVRVSTLAISGHKLYGPQGVGALYVRGGVPLERVLFGGGQEGGLR